jgi:flap endonuclease-1
LGILLTPLIDPERPKLSELAGKTLAVDGNGELYQFLALIRLRDGTPLQHPPGRITSHLVGLFYRTTRLISEIDLQLVFVFDGAPPAMKSSEIQRRREVRARYQAEMAEAQAAGDLARAYSKATMTSRLTRDMVAEARQLLGMLGLPVVQAPGEGEAQAAFMAARGDVWAAASKDYDSLLFGTPRLLRFLTLSGKEFLPSKGTFRPIEPELIATDRLLALHGITRAQLIDLAILVGTDFNEGIKGIGPKKALKLVREYGTIESMPEQIQQQVPDFVEVRRIYTEPDTIDRYDMQFGDADEDAVIRFLCDDRGFARDRVEAGLKRIRKGPLFR